MAVNRTKVLEAAQKFLSKGQYDKAIVEYQRLVAEDPRDVRTLLKIGDLHTKRSKPKDAIEVYLKVAELYAKQGFFLKAVAVYKQILKLDGAHLEASQKLAKMYEELALTSDALNTYEQVADAYLAQGQTDKALETMERMVELDAQNVAVRIKYAEALSKANKTKEAAKAFAEGAALLKEQGRMDDYIRVVERQLYHDPDNLELARSVSNLYLDRQDPKRALAKLQICFKADPRDVQTLEMLAEAFRQLGQIPKTISVLKEISRLHAEFDATEARRRTLQRVLDLDPNDAEARQGMGGAPTQAQATGPAAPVPGPPAVQDRMPTATQIERMGAPAEAQRTIRGLAPSAAAAVAGAAALAAERAAQAEAVRAVQAAGRGGRASSSFPPVPSPSQEAELSIDDGDDYDLLDASDDMDFASDDRDADEVLIIDESSESPIFAEAVAQKPATVRQPEGPAERITRLLSDADAHEGYGLHDKVESLLKEVLTLDSEHLPTHERLKDLYVATDRRVDAARELLWLSNAWSDRNRSRAIQYAREAHGLAPHAAPIKARLAALGVDPGRAAPSSEEVRLGQGSPAPAAGRPVAPSVIATREPAPAPPASLQEAAIAAQPEQDVLELPITPDEFDAAPPIPSHALYTEQYADLLEREVAPEEFDREQPQLAPESAAIPAPGRPSMADLLDAPISPDEFDAPPPRRSSVGPSDLRELLERPLPQDDFGLSDERFDRSGLIDADSTEIGDAVEIRAAVAQSLVPHDISPTVPPAETYTPDANEPSVEFVEVGTGELDVHNFGPSEAPAQPQSSAPEAFAELASGEIEFDRLDLIPESARATVQPRGRPSLPGLPPPASAPRKSPAEPPQVPPPPGLAGPQGKALPRPPSRPPPPAANAKADHSEAFGAVTRGPAGVEPPSQADLLTSSVDSTETGDLIIPVEEFTTPGLVVEELANDMTPEIEETIDEADFFASQGMMEEAVELIQEAMLIYPSNRILRAKMKEYETEADAQEAQKAAEADAKKNEDDSFGIAEQLADGPHGAGPGAANDEMVDVESVFAQFKKGVAEQVDIDDSETHFDLAIAYKEMGLISDAIQEFEIAARGPRRACAALTMIGTCALEQGDPKRAVEQFNRALATQHKGAGEELALQYELGNAYELLGQLDRALKAFEQAAMRDRSFRDVGQRVDQLRRKRGSANADDAEVDAALDELLGGE